MSLNLKDIIGEAWQGKSFKELSEASVGIFKEVSEQGAAILKDVFKVNTIKDLANNKYVQWAQSIAKVKDYREFVDKSLETKSLKEIADANISELKGISDKGFEAINKVLHATTIKDLGANKFVEYAQSIVDAFNKDKKIDIKNLVDKAYETKPLQEVVNASINALQGISDAGFDAIKKVLHVNTINDLANNKFVLWAQALTKARDFKELVDKSIDAKPIKEIVEENIKIFKDFNQSSADALKKVFNIQSISDLANSKFVKWAQEIVSAADKEVKAESTAKPTTTKKK